MSKRDAQIVMRVFFRLGAIIEREQNFDDRWALWGLMVALQVRIFDRSGLVELGD